MRDEVGLEVGGGVLGIITLYMDLVIARGERETLRVTGRGRSMGVHGREGI